MFPFTQDADIGESTPSSDLSYEVPEVFDLDADDPILLGGGRAGSDGDVDDELEMGDSARSTSPYEIVLGFDPTD